MNKRSCDYSVAQVYFYLDGEATWVKRFRIRRHLRKCHECSGAYSFESRLKAVVRERLQEDPKPEVIDRLRTFLKENQPDSGN